MSDSDERLMYLDSLQGELPQESGEHPVSSYFEHKWAGNTNLIEKDLEELEKNDAIHREQLAESLKTDTQKADNFKKQREIYILLLNFATKLAGIDRFLPLPECKAQVKKLLKKLLKLQTELLSIGLTPSLKTVNSNNQVIWEWLSELTRQWSRRLDLRIGVDIINQVAQEAEVKEDFSVTELLLREIRQTEAKTRNSTKKAKHKASKHRKLKFDVHEKLLNFMTPEAAVLEKKHENLIVSLFDRREYTSTNKVFLDIPLI